MHKSKISTKHVSVIVQLAAFEVFTNYLSFHSKLLQNIKTLGKVVAIYVGFICMGILAQVNHLLTNLPAEYCHLLKT